jgi:hypothetical protein
MSAFIQEYFHLLSALMGALCVYEAKILLKANDYWIFDKRLLWTTSLEFAWLIVCCLGLLGWNLSGWKIISCLIFLVNYLVACAYTWLIFRGADFTDPNFAKDFRIPRWYLEYYFSFGAIYSVVNLVLFF